MFTFQWEKYPLRVFLWHHRWQREPKTNFEIQMKVIPPEVCAWWAPAGSPSETSKVESWQAMGWDPAQRAGNVDHMGGTTTDPTQRA